MADEEPLTGTGEKESLVVTTADGDEYNDEQLALADDDDLIYDDNHDLICEEDDGLICEDDGEDDDIICNCKIESPPDHKVGYYGDSENLKAAYSYSRDLVEILSVRPRGFSFVGQFAAFNDRSIYSCFPSQLPHTVDSRGNLILKAAGSAIEDYFCIKLEMPTPDDDDDKYDFGNLYFRVDPYACNNVITRTIRTLYYRDIDVTFVPMYRAIQANVYVNLVDLPSSGSGSGSICYVHGEITAHHQFYGEKNNVLLFLRGEDDKAEVNIAAVADDDDDDDGKLALLRNWAVVPIYLEPLLIIKLSLGVVFTNNLEDGNHTIISFQGDLTFERDQYKKTICNAKGHGKVEVQIRYR